MAEPIIGKRTTRNSRGLINKEIPIPAKRQRRIIDNLLGEPRGVEQNIIQQTKVNEKLFKIHEKNNQNENGITKLDNNVKLRGNILQRVPVNLMDKTNEIIIDPVNKSNVLKPIQNGTNLLNEVMNMVKCPSGLFKDINNENKTTINQMGAVEKLNAPQKDIEWKQFVNTFTGKLPNSIQHVPDDNNQIVKKERSNQNYLDLLALEHSAGIIVSSEKFECTICLGDIEPNNGIILRNCLHHFCKECTIETIMHSDTGDVKCPYMDENYSCQDIIQDREIRSTLSKEQHELYLAKTLSLAEKVTSNAFHCKLADCNGWVVVENDQIQLYRCPICYSVNCIQCSAIHFGMNCKQYQDGLQLNDADKKTQISIIELLQSGTAMKCPKCNIIINKRDGCDWLRCTMCLTEICWATKLSRWGPNGKGDTTGGCKCNIYGKKCHPECRNCH